MKDDYLWDGSGEVDAETAELESMLGQFRHRPQALKLPAELPPPAPFIKTRGGLRYQVAAAAALIIAALSAAMLYYMPAPAQKIVTVTPIAGHKQNTISQKAAVTAHRAAANNRPAKHELAESEAAAQVLIALHITGNKLALAKKQVLTVYQNNQPNGEDYEESN